MDNGTHSEAEYIPNGPPEESIFTSFGGGMFAGSQHFNIGGGTFNNTTNHFHPAPTEAPNFRTIPMGDIDLQQELMVTGHSGLVSHRRAQNCVRRVYSAKMDGLNKDWTVAMYEGDGAEEAWQHDVEIYMSLRVAGVGFRTDSEPEPNPNRTSVEVRGSAKVLRSQTDPTSLHTWQRMLVLKYVGASLDAAHIHVPEVPGWH
ncbi:hypothetical protein B0H16DRAFT_1485029 [Mycena metata]|uniref:Uncharacterized protein n=1 Tax=Mycena metata TaxID=1033252 RepID=A0AAD7GLC0_9AGAR|nr:hypothetical protein B0H16DRAFT_1485029 [Mycena metata]